MAAVYGRPVQPPFDADIEAKKASWPGRMRGASGWVSRTWSAWATRGSHHRGSAVLMADVSGTPDRLLVKVTEGAMWWSLDDRARELIGDDDMVAWTQEGGYRKVRSGCVRRLLSEFEPLDRPEFRRLPDRSAWKGVGRAGMDQSLSAYVGSVMVGR
ncbi:hypothetical protein E1267_13840 [Nonomuraea longispora]|uniref:Uncharacterized protein n=1 Tax=Nonomuraea longispora TaxID=1848320 RepID=A0A4R4NFR6_9ACTN|nr:hypothetical protein [Nonomuraea longispora]TDC07284.1 hypothetical protein E1267_13840 [Nonomuraea longispora]